MRISTFCTPRDTSSPVRFHRSLLTVRRAATRFSSLHSPWIVQAHKFQSYTLLYANQADVARFAIWDEPGEYIMHWWWRGYSHCIDIAVLPNDATAGTVVPSTPTSARYGVVQNSYVFNRMDHAQFSLQYMDYTYFLTQSTTLANGVCSDNPITQASVLRTCFVVPPEGGKNALGETAEQAVAACRDRCIGLGSGCIGVSVVPIDQPPPVRFRSTNAPYAGTTSWPVTETNVPWGQSNCNRACLSGEADVANSMYCFPQLLVGSNMYLTAKPQVVPNDPRSEVFYSTIFKKVRGVSFDGLTTTCMDYKPSATPSTPMCDIAKPLPQWQFGDKCVSCATVEQNQNDSTVVTRWSIIADDECKMCSYTPEPPVPAPTPAPTIDGAGFSDTSLWLRNWTSPDGKLFIGWKHGGLDAADVDAADALTFVVSCPTCEADGWVAIGINPSAGPDGQMINTSAVIWDMLSGKVQEYEIKSKSAMGLMRWGQFQHVDRVATDPAKKRATFSLGVGEKAYIPKKWEVGSGSIASSSKHAVTYAYATSGGMSTKHAARGVAKFDFSLEDAAASAAAGSSVGESNAKAAWVTTLAILAAAGANAIIALAAVVAVLVLFMVRRKRMSDPTYGAQSDGPVKSVVVGTAVAPALPSRPGLPGPSTANAVELVVPVRERAASRVVSIERVEPRVVSEPRIASVVRETRNPLDAALTHADLAAQKRLSTKRPHSVRM